MKNKKKYFLIILSILLIFLYLSLNKKNNHNYKTDLIQNRDNLLSFSRDNLDSKIKNNTNELEINNSSYEFSKEKIAIIKMIKNLKDKYTYINFEKEFKDSFFSMYYSGNQRKIVNIIQEILLDKENAIKIAGDNQAYARVFAIKALKELAIIGNQEPLIDTINKITRNFDEKKLINKGEEADIYDLVSSFISIQNSEELEKNLGFYLTNIGFKGSLKNKELKDIFDQSVFFSLKSKFGREKTTAIMSKYFSDT
ncbi:hypothetical protein ACWNT8_11470 [Pigmentibacter ruber]|uniref:hypothetical protein n=1 Tax=Pigmentibacter ruber TaxID=2683196 RepID=UPI00131CD14F|nr:hypothetical protein [Pigmentibacter ruber]